MAESDIEIECASQETKKKQFLHIPKSSAKYRRVFFTVTKNAMNLPELFGCRLKIFVIELEKLFRFESPRLNASYAGPGVVSGGVGFVPSIAFFRAFTNRCSRSINSKRLLSTSSNDSSLTGSSASICCFRILNNYEWNDEFDK